MGRQIAFSAGAVMLAMALVLGAPAPAAWADLVGTLFHPNDAISSFPPIYGTITIHLIDSTHAEITFVNATHDGFVYLFAGAQAVDFNANIDGGTSVSVSGLAGTCEFATCGPLSSSVDLTGTQVDGQGQYNVTVDAFNGFDSAFSEIHFELTLLGGGSWGDASDVRSINTDGFWAAAHIFVCSDPCLESNGAIATGFAGGAVQTPVPEPGVLTLFGTGLALVGTLARRFKRK